MGRSVGHFETLQKAVEMNRGDDPRVSSIEEVLDLQTRVLETYRDPLHDRGSIEFAVRMPPQTFGHPCVVPVVFIDSLGDAVC